MQPTTDVGLLSSGGPRGQYRRRMDRRSELLNPGLDILIEKNLPVAIRDGVPLAVQISR
jgi:hypothetical protein